MPTIVFGEFGGENRKRSEFLLASHEAAQATNVDFVSGKARPFNRSRFRERVFLKAAARSIAGFAGKIHDFDHASETAFVGGRGNAEDRLLITGDGIAPGILRAGNNDPQSLGVGMGLRVTATANGTADESPTAIIRDHVFGVAVRNALGVESPIFTAPPIQMTQEQTASVASVSTPADEDYLTEEWRARNTGNNTPPEQFETNDELTYILYRATTGVFLPVAQNDDGQFNNIPWNASAVSSLPAQYVGEETRPRLDMRGIGVHPKGFAFGFVNDRLCFSAPEQIGVWPRSLEIEIPDGDIIAVREWNSNLYVFPKNRPPLLVRLDSPRTADLRRLESSWILDERLVRTLVKVGEFGLMYCTAAGVVLLAGAQAQLITADKLSERGARPFSPPTFAFSVRDEYFGVRDDGTMIYLTTRGARGGVQIGTLENMTEGNVIDAAEIAGTTALLTTGGDVYTWRAGEPAQMTWQSGRVRLLDKTNLALLWVWGGESSKHEVFHVRTPSLDAPNFVSFDTGEAPPVISDSTKTVGEGTSETQYRQQRFLGSGINNADISLGGSAVLSSVFLYLETDVSAEERCLWMQQDSGFVTSTATVKFTNGNDSYSVRLGEGRRIRRHTCYDIPPGELDKVRRIYTKGGQVRVEVSSSSSSFAVYPPVGDIIEGTSGGVQVSVLTETGEEEVVLPEDGDPRDVFDNGGCDCAVWLREHDVTAWFSILVRAEREIDAVGVYADMDDFIDAKQQSGGVFPPQGIGV